MALSLSFRAVTLAELTFAPVLSPHCFHISFCKNLLMKYMPNCYQLLYSLDILFFKHFQVSRYQCKFYELCR